MLRKIARANESVQGLFNTIKKSKNLMQEFPTAYSLAQAVVNQLSPFVIVVGRKAEGLELEVRELKELILFMG